MSKIVAKLYLTGSQQNMQGQRSYNAQAVCRGEENKDWSSATPHANLTIPANDHLDELWARKLSGEVQNPEFLLYMTEHVEEPGAFQLIQCRHDYGTGVQVEMTCKDRWDCKLVTSIRATGAAQALLQAFARGIVEGQRSWWRFTTADAM